MSAVVKVVSVHEKPEAFLLMLIDFVGDETSLDGAWYILIGVDEEVELGWEDLSSTIGPFYALVTAKLQYFFG